MRCSKTCRAASRGTYPTILLKSNGTIYESGFIKVTDVLWTVCSNRLCGYLIEIAVVKGAVRTDIDQVTALKARHRTGVKGLTGVSHVMVQGAAIKEKTPEAPQRYVSKRVKPVKKDPVLFSKMCLVILFEDLL